MQNAQSIFKLHSDYQPTGDQPQAIEALVKGFREGNQCQTLLGVTGSGKTFTMANVIQQLERPTLVIAHNKTLAAQLYGEFKEFFPENAVEYWPVNVAYRIWIMSVVKNRKHFNHWVQAYLFTEMFSGKV